MVLQRTSFRVRSSIALSLVSKLVRKFMHLFTSKTIYSVLYPRPKDELDRQIVSLADGT